MKYGNHQNYCNGPGDCSCGEDHRGFANRSIVRARENGEEARKLRDKVVKLKKQVAYWKGKVEELAGGSTAQQSSAGLTDTG